jgi:hypothetical protein
MRTSKCAIMAPMPTPKKSLYEILGVERDANSIDIGLAYERRREEAAKRVPPDATEITLVQQAYEVLSDPARRRTYDASLVTAAERAAAAEQPPDLLLEPEAPPRARSPIWVGAVAGLVVIVAAVYFTLRAPAPPPKEPPAEPPKAVQAPPPPPKPLAPATILAGVTSSVGQVLSYDMAGQAKPLGLAAATDRGVFVTTCHGIAAGAQLVVRIGLESHSANLALADEELDLCKLAVPELKGAGIPIARDELRNGDKLFVVGANAKGEMALTETKVKALRPIPGGAKVIELDVPIAANGSGGAVLDAFGRLVGVATTQHGLGAGLSIALPVAWLEQMRSRSKRV